MRAWTIEQHGDFRERLRQVDNVPEPRPGQGEALVSVRAVGLNFADLLSIEGRYQIKAPLPFTPGIEAAGIVDRPDEGGHLRQGQRVAMTAPWGALAERIAVPWQSCFPVPDSMGDHEAAALVLTYQTAHVALVRRASLRRGEAVLVHNGAGGVGTAAIQVARALGARVAATAGGDSKLDVCRRMGAERVIDYNSEDFVEAVRDWTGGNGADVIFDSVGGDVFDGSTRCIAFEGRLLVIGFAGGRIPSIAANRVMLKNISVVGLNWGAYRDRASPLLAEVHAELCRLHAQGEIAPLLHRTYAFEELPQALSDLQERRSVGKLVVLV